MKLLLAAITGTVMTLSAFAADELRIGIIGLDTSHVTAFTKLLNDPKHKDHVPGARVVAAFKGGSPDVESSASRVDGFTKQLQDEFGVKIVPSIEELCQQVDAVLLESVDGRPHLEQARPVIKAAQAALHRQACSLVHAARTRLKSYRLAKAANVPVFSSSSYRLLPRVWLR